MTTRARSRAAAVAGVLVLSALAGCGGGDGDGGAEGDAATSSGTPPCSDWADGQTLTEELTLSGCSDEATTTNALSSCDDHDIIAVGPVYGFVGKPANYLGEGVDATKSEEWQTFQQECPYDSE